MNNQNIELAFTAQLEAEKFAEAHEGETLPEPPAGFPHLPSLNGEGLQGALVLGYVIGKYENVTHYYDGKDNKKNPGDDGFLDATLSRFYKGYKMPKGWRIEQTKARFIYALVKGNPILLEEPARKLGYHRALATSPTFIKLCEYC